MNLKEEFLLDFLKNKRILVTGANGFVGTNLVKFLKKLNEKLDINLKFTIITLNGKKDLDLTKQFEVVEFLASHNIDYIIHLAGLVGGIKSMLLHPAEHYYQNLISSTFIIHYGVKYKVKKIMLVGAGCSYPVDFNVLREEDMWRGLPQKESLTYSLAKRVLQMQGIAYEAEYKIPTIIPLPGNIYGEFDNFNLEHSHVVPALIRKFFEAKKYNKTSVEVWGSGNAIRDFIYIQDAIKGMLYSFAFFNKTEIINISNGKGNSIKQLSEIIKEVIGFKGEVVYNIHNPEGQSKRILSMEKIEKAFDWHSDNSLKQGIEKTVKWFEENYNVPGAIRL